MSVLVIDDDIAVCASLRLLLKQAGYEVHTSTTPEEALQWVRHNTPSLILMDMNYSIETSGREGLELLQKVRIFHPLVPIILITGWASISLAVEGIKKGASDFVSKPWDNEALLQSVKSNLQWAKINHEPTTSTRKELDQYFNLGAIVGEHESLMEVLSVSVRIAPSQATVLITGESGTGKELIAEAIHLNSKRKNNPFVKVNLGGISESLFESEMFGHKKGAFTDAISDRVGRFQMAEGGTIFLDEIAELSMSSQVKLLRVLQERTFDVLGESKSLKADVRVICATNRNLAEMVRAGTFREDLYYRINLIHIHLPSLRQRPSDIPLLAASFIQHVCNSNQLQPKQLSKDAISYLKKLPFAGNIRELKNLMERCVLMSQDVLISEENLVRYSENISAMVDPLKTPGIVTLDQVEKDTILKTMELYNGNVSRVAHVLGLSRGALYRRFEKHKIPYEH
ncbi:MAG: sigma-54 dependent transcriptional regulator [Bacteroidales bacterium]|nr:sigma-54 dependent transcriptional regulator [Bacteroidales bacterium]